MRVMWALLIWLAVCPFASSAFAEDAVVPVPRDDEALMPIPDVPPPGWSEEQLASLRRMEIRLLHVDSLPDMKDGKSVDYEIDLALWDPEQPAGQPLCIKRLRITTNAGILRFPRLDSFPALTADECMKLGGSNFDASPRTPGHMGRIWPTLTPPVGMDLERFHINKAEIDVSPAPGSAGHAAMLRRLDVRSRLRSVPTPTPQLITPKGPLPVAGPEVDVAYSDWWRKGSHYSIPSQKIRVHVASVYNTTPDQPGMRQYTLTFTPTPVGSEGFWGMRVWTDFGYSEVTNGFLSCSPAFFAGPSIKRITIRKLRVWNSEKMAWVDGMPLLVRYDFKRLPFISDDGELPQSSPGWIRYYKNWGNDLP